MKKRSIIIIACLVILTLSVGMTAAYIITESLSANNRFTPANVTCEVEENFRNGLKTDVVVRNTSNIPVFIRATVVVNWISSDEKIHSKKPVENIDYTISFADDGWILAQDGFWYYTKSVTPTDVTGELIESAQYVANAPEGYTLGINVIATAIQSEPVTAVSEAWSVTASDGELKFQ